MFWGGRAAIKNKKSKILLLGIGRGLLSSIILTYYGALGHFLSRDYRRKSFALQPSISTKFDEGFYEPFTKTVQSRLIELSFCCLWVKEEYASCEIKELGDESIVNHDKAKVAKALMYYALRIGYKQ